LTKGHPLVWHEVWPGWAPQTADESKPLLRQRIADIIPRYKGLVQYWDVQNEANNSADYPKTGVGDWARRDGPAAMVRQTLAWAREASKGAGAILLYNDFNTTELNVKLLEDLRGLGALPDVIGIQSHMHSGPWQDVEVWRVCRRFGQFGLPIHFTETTIVSGPQQATDPRDPPAGWQSTPEGEAAQAAAVERLYRILFSHPSVSAVTWWDFADRNAWMGAPAGLLRKDMTPKPAYQRLVEMVRREWWTRANARTSRSGTASVRAFLGDHKIVVTAPNGANVERNVRLTRRTGKAGLTVTVTLP
jgi:GH35 family endo-1,4-beta-xylanase